MPSVKATTSSSPRESATSLSWPAKVNIESLTPAIFLLVGFALVGVWQTPQRISADCAVSLQQAELLLDGATPYLDFVDTDRPLIAYLNVVPVWLARALGISPIVAFGGLVAALLLVSTLEIHFLLRQWRLGLPPAGRGLVLLAWIVSYFVVDWRGDAGGRDHLFILLYVPYLFLRVLRYRGGSVAAWFAVLLGAQAGIGAALKPLFLLLAVNVELVLLFTTRRRRMLMKTENAALLGVVAAYMAHWLLVPVAMREAFYGRWQPLLSYGYRVYGMSYLEVARSVFESPISMLGVAAAVAATVLCVRGTARLRHHLVVLAALADMALLTIFLQQQGQSGHHVPLEVAGLMCFAVLFAEGNWQWSGSQAPTARVYGAWAAGGLLLALFLAAWLVQRKDEPDTPAVAAIGKVVRERSRPGDRVLVVATTAEPAYPLLLQTGRRPGSRYLYCFPIALCYAGAQPPKPGGSLYRNPSQQPAEEVQFLGELKDDIATRQPRLVIVQNSAHCPALPEGFNPFDYLVRAGLVENALELYEELPGPEGWKVFARRE